MSDWALLADSLRDSSDQASLEAEISKRGGTVNTAPTQQEIAVGVLDALKADDGLQIFANRRDELLAYTFGLTGSWRIGAVFDPKGAQDRAILAKAAGPAGPFLGGPDVVDEIRDVVHAAHHRRPLAELNQWMAWFR